MRTPLYVAIAIGSIVFGVLGAFTIGVPFSMSHTGCSNVLGIGYSGGGAYDPPLLPAFLVGLIASGLTVLVLRRLLARRTADA